MRSNSTATLSSISFVLFFIIAAQGVFSQGGAQQTDLAIDAGARRAVIDELAKQLDAIYVFPDVAKKMGIDVRSRAAAGEYDQITSARDLAARLTEDLQRISKDKHLRVRFSAQPIPVRQANRQPSEAEREEMRAFYRRGNFGFEKVQRLDGNIGYIDLRGFTDAEGGADTVAAAMALVANTDSLIFDLRQNGGGSPLMVALISSYLFGDQRVHLNDLYWRPDDRTEEFWTDPKVKGKKYVDKDVYVLTSNRTFSAGEEFTYNLKNLKRATIVGETTGGGAHPGGMVRLSDHFGVFIPSGRAINPVTKSNWEGTGVEPDVKVPQDRALKTAHVLALSKTIEKTRDEQLKRGLKEIVDRMQKELEEMKAKPAK